jgi:NADPH:quinone reductase-like Zn-dependent oxidoreductase
MFPFEFPHVLGDDVAGTVVKVGSGVTRFQPGDRVMGHSLALIKSARHGSFQNFVTCLETGVAKIPDSLSFADATVIPLGLSTAIVGLYQYLQLRQPSVTPAATAATGPRETVLIWGATSSVGSNAVQLALASGYHVLAVASTKSAAYVRGLAPAGREDRIALADYNDAAAVTAGALAARIRADGGRFAGAYDCISKPDTVAVMAAVTHAFGGGALPLVLPPPAADSGVTIPEDVHAEMLWATNPVLVADHPGVPVWRDYISAALANGSFKAKPEPQIVGHGLDKFQEALDLYAKGVSARKLVVTL